MVITYEHLHIKQKEMVVLYMHTCTFARSLLEVYIFNFVENGSIICANLPTV